MRKAVTVSILAFFLYTGSLFAQTHVSVPVDHSVYYLLSQAELRGLCSPLPAVKPYTRGRITEAIDEILAAEPRRFGSLTDAERAILEEALEEFTKGEEGLDLRNGMYRFDVQGKKGGYFSGDVGISLESINSGAYYKEDDKTYFGTDTWGTLSFKGDIGENFSFNTDFFGGLLMAKRKELGTYDIFASEREYDSLDDFYADRKNTYSQPLAYFPYAYQKRWDGFMFGSGDVSAGSMYFWPEKRSMGTGMMAEMAGSAFDDMLLLRAGRIRREWGGMVPGSSLVLNGTARPFVGMEMIFNPASWFSFSSLTGGLEFSNAEGISEPALSFQNVFSIQQMELNYKNYFHIDFGSTAIWPKRLELGYIFPLIDNFLNQNFIGDFDNMAVFLNIKGQYPGLGSLWFSLFIDEVEVSSIEKAFKLDRHMFAYQFGLQGVIPGLPFASFTLSYTKIEPYNYTHQKIITPWYSNLMETAYVNNGVSLGYYLPPNSDEIKLRLDIRPWLRTASFFQYQMIRHGADYGRHQVDGSSLISELDEDRSTKVSLRKNFLHDGAYQWMHIFKIGGEHKFSSLPVTIFGEAGVVYSYFTDISDSKYENYHPQEPMNDGSSTPRPLAKGSYPKSTAFILTIGFRIFR